MKKQGKKLFHFFPSNYPAIYVKNLAKLKWLYFFLSDRPLVILKSSEEKCYHTHSVLCNVERSFFTSSEVAVYYETQLTTISNKNAQIQKLMLTPLRYTPSDTKIIKNKVLPQKMWICGKIYFERFFNYFPFSREVVGKKLRLRKKFATSIFDKCSSSRAFKT